MIEQSLKVAESRKERIDCLRSRGEEDWKEVRKERHSSIEGCEPRGVRSADGL